MSDRDIKTCDNIIKKIEEHRAVINKIQSDNRKLNDSFITGYYRGIQEGLESAINIIKEYENLQHRKYVKYHSEKAKRELSKK